MSFWCICIKIEILETHTQKKHVLNEFQIMQSVNIDLIFQKLANWKLLLALMKFQCIQVFLVLDNSTPNFHLK